MGVRRNLARKAIASDSATADVDACSRCNCEYIALISMAVSARGKATTHFLIEIELKFSPLSPHLPR